MEYDGVMSLGTFCQVGGALWLYELKNINSPLDNFGIKRWESVADILESRFEYYWRLDNMGTGKVVEEFCGALPGQKKMMMKAYDNRYDLVSNHNFQEEENPNGELKTYDHFRSKLTFLEEVFLKQCAIYGNVRFVMKAMSWPNPHDTKVEPAELDRLMTVLNDLRGGKPFDLSIAVPVKEYERVSAWAQESKWADSLMVSSWEIDFNNEKHPEWDELFKDIELYHDYYWHLVSEVIGDTTINLMEVNNF